MTGLFLAEQIKSVLLNLLTDQVENAGHAAADFVRSKKLARDADLQTEKLGRTKSGII